MSVDGEMHSYSILSDIFALVLQPLSGLEGKYEDK
jgi:hypothetical protein